MQARMWDSLPKVILIVMNTHCTKVAVSHEHDPDVSKHICWVGDWTLERCCRGDATTSPQCWNDGYTFEECCPNSDCWDSDKRTFQNCCNVAIHGQLGNESCWSGAYTFQHCCLANSSAQHWVEILAKGLETDKLYSMDSFYSDAQYSDEFGYYSTGHVLRDQVAYQADAQEFEHFTTYPMALSPHFGRIICRMLFIMWLHMNERAPFRVVEMGAGTGQLAVDIQTCVQSNELGIAPSVWRRWLAAFEYLIIEISPALAARQREKGLRVVHGDAQEVSSCKSISAALSESAACQGERLAFSSQECMASKRGTSENGVSVVLSNELLDALSPIKLWLDTRMQPQVKECRSWHEMLLVHLIHKEELHEISTVLSHSQSRIRSLVHDLHEFTESFFCQSIQSTVGKAARDAAPTGTCIALVLGLNHILNKAEFQYPSAAHNMRLRLLKDNTLRDHFQKIVDEINKESLNMLALPRDVYRMYRRELRNMSSLESRFLASVETKQISVPLSEIHCQELTWWMSTHEARLQRLVDLYTSLGYPAVHILARPGESKFVDLADCLVGTGGGFMLNIDYGASFEALGHSLSIDRDSDGVFIPPIPQKFLEELPDCYGSWVKCAGRVDWTTFVDFTNVAAAGVHLGWRSLLYGPQSFLEHMSSRSFTTTSGSYSIPGYSVLESSSRLPFIQNWYGHESLAPGTEGHLWQQSWTSFKALIMEKPSMPSDLPAAVAVFPSWHLDASDVDECWSFDPSSLPLADWVARQKQRDPRKALQELTHEMHDSLGQRYSEAYEEAQLAVRMVDWLIANEGCDSFRASNATSMFTTSGLWQSLRTRLVFAWESIWDAEVIERIAQAVLWRLAQGLLQTPISPFECLGQQTFIALCENTGQGMLSGGFARA